MTTTLSGIAEELERRIEAFHDGLPQGQGETGDGGKAGKELCQWVYDNAETLATLIRTAEDREKVLREAIIAVVEATRAYLPPDRIGAQECINRILGATDNPTINPIIAEIENGRH